jgi:3-dehydroquinate dehydratase-2
MKIMVISGVNLKYTGQRDAAFYGNETLESINREIMEAGRRRGIDVDFFASDIEGEIVDCIWRAKNYDGIIINAGAYSHYSIAIRDALEGVKVPAVEVHMSNIFAREEFRHKSVLTSVCRGHISGFGKKSYILALLSFLEGDI